MVRCEDRATFRFGCTADSKRSTASTLSHSVIDAVSIALIVGVAAAIYMVAGFGFALFAVPATSFLLGVTHAVALISVLGLLTTIRQVIVLRPHIDRAVATPLSLWAVIGMPFGLYLSAVASDAALRIALGTSTLLAVLVMFVRRGSVTNNVWRDGFFAWVSGVLNTSIGTNGPPLVFALEGRRLRPDGFRGTLAAVFAVSGLATCALLALDHRYENSTLVYVAVSLPTWFLGTIAGRRLANAINEQQFAVVVRVLLVVTGVAMLISGATS